MVVRAVARLAKAATMGLLPVSVCSISKDLFTHPASTSWGDIRGRGARARLLTLTSLACMLVDVLERSGQMTFPRTLILVAVPCRGNHSTGS